MTEIFRTAMGRTFYDHTLPTIAKELARLNDQLERIAAALETKTTENEGNANDKIKD